MSDKEIVSRKDWLKEEINEKRIEHNKLLATRIAAHSETGDDMMILQEQIDWINHEISELESTLSIEEGKEVVELPPFVVNDFNPVMSFAENIDWSISILDIPRIHKEFGLTGRGVKVAVCDTGISDHEDLAGAVIERHNTTSEPYPTNLDGFNGHGIAVASLIGARRNNMGILSVAPECKIIAIKCLFESGSGTMVDITEAINLAVDRGAHIINLSLGGASSTPALHAAVKRAHARGIYVICAAGNSGGENTVGYPGRYEESYAVAAINNQRRISAFSSRGLEVDISAPGERVLTCFKNNGYTTISGTSFSSPVVAGCFALFKQAGIKLPPRLLKDTAIDIEEPGRDNRSGSGIINPYEIINKYYRKIYADEAECVPPVVTVTELSSNRAKLEWSDVTPAVNYTVFFGQDYEEIVGEKEAVFHDLIPGTKYIVEVRANCEYGISSNTVVEFTTLTDGSPPIDNPPPPPVTGARCEPPVVVVTNLTATSAKFEWATATAFNYHVFFGTNVDILRDKVFELTGLQPNTRYSLGVRANCSNGVSEVTPVEFTTKSLTPPSPQSSVSSSASSSPSEPAENPDDKLIDARSRIREADRLITEYLSA